MTRYMNISAALAAIIALQLSGCVELEPQPETAPTVQDQAREVAWSDAENPPPLETAECMLDAEDDNWLECSEEAGTEGSAFKISSGSSVGSYLESKNTRYEWDPSCQCWRWFSTCWIIDGELCCIARDNRGWCPGATQMRL